MDGKIKPKQPIIIRISGLCGIFAPIVFFIFIALAIYYSPWFIWTENWLSDLGGLVGETPIWAAKGIASVIFNIGILLSGIMAIFFASVIRKIKILNSRSGRVGSRLLIIDMFFLCAAGLFPNTTGYLHGIFSFLFFLFIILSLLFIGTAIIGSSRKSLGYFVTIIGGISFFSFPLLFVSEPWGSNAIAEMFPIVSIMLFFIIFGIFLLKGNFSLILN